MPIVSDDEEVLQIPKKLKAGDYTHFNVLQEGREVSCSVYVDGFKIRGKKYFYTTKEMFNSKHVYFASDDYTKFGYWDFKTIITTDSVNIANDSSSFLLKCNLAPDAGLIIASKSLL